MQLKGMVRMKRTVDTEWLQLVGGPFHLRNRGPGNVIYNTGTPADEGDGILLGKDDTVQIGASAVWVRSTNLPSVIAYQVLAGVNESATVSRREQAVADGRVYAVGGSDADVPTGQTFDFVMSVGAGIAILKTVHIQAQLSQFTFELYRSPSWSGGGIAQTRNLNDNYSGSDSNVAFTSQEPVIASAGEVLMSQSTYGADAGGSSGRYCEQVYNLGMILRPETEYLLRVINGSGSGGGMTVDVEWSAE